AARPTPLIIIVGLTRRTISKVSIPIKIPRRMNTVDLRIDSNRRIRPPFEAVKYEYEHVKKEDEEGVFPALPLSLTYKSLYLVVGILQHHYFVSIASVIHFSNYNMVAPASFH